MAKKYLINLNVDETLLDSNYKSTAPTINGVIRQLEAEGHIFLLNSNRALEDLLPIAHQFNLSGPIIVENGCYIYHPATKTNDLIIDGESIVQINQLKAILPELINVNFKSADLRTADTTELAKETQSQLDSKTAIDNYFVLNRYRKYTISLHVRDKNHAHDLKSLKLLHHMVQEYIQRQNFALIAEYSPTYSNLLVYPSRCHKGAALKFLSDQTPGAIRIGISHDYLDKSLMQEMDLFFAVSNSSQEVKDIADYVATEKITKGVEEILLNLDKIIAERN